MNVLWIVNKRCGALHQKLHGKKSTGGLWLDAMLDEAYGTDDNIVVVNIEKKPALKYLRDNNISYYTLQGEPNHKYDYKSKVNIQAFKQIIEKEKIDVLQIWGTEFPYALAAFEAAPDLPSVVYIQGVLDSIAKYYLASLSAKELKEAVTLRDLLTNSTIKSTQKQYEKRSLYEKQIICRSGHIIVENLWAQAYYKKINTDVAVHFCPITISSTFFEKTWDSTKTQSHSIMCSAANYPIKGLHMLLKALSIVKNTYPDVRLYIPGTVLKNTSTLKNRIKQNGYDRLITKMIDKLNLSDNIIYTGRLTAEEMADKMSSVSCFVMSSAIENHSSTLKEAMAVGTPCVASYVGGVPEYVRNEENALLYRYEDYEMLAYNIIRLFADSELAKRLSSCAKSQMSMPKEESDYTKIKNILEKVTQKQQ